MREADHTPTPPRWPRGGGHGGLPTDPLLPFVLLARSPARTGGASHSSAPASRWRPRRCCRSAGEVGGIGVWIRPPSSVQRRAAGPGIAGSRTTMTTSPSPSVGIPPSHPGHPLHPLLPPSCSRHARNGGGREDRVGPASVATSAMAEPLNSSGSRGFQGRRHSPGLL
jgi:hypothetical protein